MKGDLLRYANFKHTFNLNDNYDSLMYIIKSINYVENKQKNYLQLQQVFRHEQQYAFHMYTSSMHSDDSLFARESLQVAGHHKSPAFFVQHSLQTGLSSLPEQKKTSHKTLSPVLSNYNKYEKHKQK